jgi:SOS response regulatory protein OraA/RecX
MDQLGNVFRTYLSEVRASRLRSAQAMADELRRDGMSKTEIEEMLFANGFESEVIKEVIGKIKKT